MRKGVVALALACAGAQLAPGTALLASALGLALHATDHEHSVSLAPAEGHVHLVLSHEERSRPDRAGAGHRDHVPAPAPERDHVLHLSDDCAGGTGPRRASLPVAPAVATVVAALAAPAPLWVLRPALEPRARSSDPLRSVVLRL